MNKNLIILIYYIYAIIVIFTFCYIVFWLNHSSWWFILMALLLDRTPKINNQ